MRKSIPFALLILLLLFQSNAIASSSKQNLVLIELFTSEGCSSCPPADKLLAEIAQKFPESVAALSEHVDYWNGLGWPDPYSSPAFTKRQQNYCSKLSVSSVYTPQIVINGTHQGIGSESANIYQMLSDAQRELHNSIAVSAKKVGPPLRLSVSVQFGQCPADAELFVAITEDNLSSKVKSGENAGLTLPHTAVTRFLQSKPVSELQNRSCTMTIDGAQTWNLQNLHVVAFVQESNQGHILAVAKTTIHD